MEKNRKLGIWVLGCLLLGTFGAHAAYQARWPLTTEPRPLVRTPANVTRPWLATPDPIVDNTPASPGALKISAAVDRTAVLQSGDGVVHVELTVDTHGLGEPARVPTDFLVVLDRSGSMSGEKLNYGKQALRELIQRLGDDDRLGLVTYESRAEVAIELADVARGQRQDWLRVVDQLQTAGGTNMSAGLDVALAQIAYAHKHGNAARILLLSDGLANEGDATPGGLAARAARASQSEFVLSTIGIGADFDERMMTSLARAGTGAFYYLAKLAVLPEFVSAELRTASETYAQNAQIELELEPGVSLSDASGSNFQVHGDSVVVPLGSLYSNHARSTWLTLKVPTDRLGQRAIGGIQVRYRREDKPFTVAANTLPPIACVGNEQDFRRGIVEKLWERATLDEELGRRKEELGEAIRSGTAADVARVKSLAMPARALAQQLGNDKVLDRLTDFDKRADEAKEAQLKGGEARVTAAKKQTADGFSSRGQSLYLNANPGRGY